MKRLVVVGTVINIALALAFERWRPLDLTYDGLWNARVGVWAGLLLLDNLAVLWWYARLTKQLVEKAEEQRGLMEQQLAQAQKEYQESQGRLLVAQKPDVYTERVEDLEHPGRVNYFMRNAGGGPSSNVYYVHLYDLLFGGPVSLGSLAAGDTRPLPASVNKILQEGHFGIKFVLLAEAHYTRTRQWTPTLNIRTSTAGPHSGQVLYRAAIPAIQPPLGQRQSISEYMRNNNEHFAEQLLAFGEEEGAA